MSIDRLLTAIMDANIRIPDVTFLGLIGRPVHPITICMCADYLIPLTLYEGNDVDEALKAMANAVTSLEQAHSV